MISYINTDGENIIGAPKVIALLTLLVVAFNLFASFFVSGFDSWLLFTFALFIFITIQTIAIAIVVSLKGDIEEKKSESKSDKY